MERFRNKGSALREHPPLLLVNRIELRVEVRVRVLTHGYVHRVQYLSDAFSLHLQGLHLREVVVVGHHVGDDGLLIRVVHTNVCTHTHTHTHTRLEVRVRGQS